MLLPEKSLAESGPLVVALLFFLAAASWADPLRQELVLGNYNDAAEVKSLLMTLVPGVQLEIEDGDHFLVASSKEMVEQCLELIRQLNLRLWLPRDLRPVFC
jgi:hypothetical protein